MTSFCRKIELAQAFEYCVPAKVRTISESDTVVSENRGMAYDFEDEGLVGAILTDRGGDAVGRFARVDVYEVRLRPQFSRLCNFQNKVWRLGFIQELITWHGYFGLESHEL